MEHPRIDPESCLACGQCVAICPVQAFQKSDGGVSTNPDTVGLCFPCAHCMAICPTGAVTLLGFDHRAFGDLPSQVPDAETLRRLLVSRRSVRRFTDEPVAREDLQCILDLAVTAPMGVPPTVVEVTVFSDRQQIDALIPDVVAGTEQFVEAMGKPLPRFFIRRSMGPERFDALAEIMRPLLGFLCRAYREEGQDYATWGAPAMLLFHASRASSAGRENCLIAATYAVLAAHSLGLGATIIGTVAPVVERNQALRTRLSIPEKNEVAISVVVGHPAREFRRAIPRQFRKVTWVA